MSKITDLVETMARPVAEANGCSLWDVEYVKEAGSWYLRLYIDKEGGVSIDDCEAVSRALDPMLDEADPIPDAYTFEVSSAGCERQLKRPGDFARFLGSPMRRRLFIRFKKQPDNQRIRRIECRFSALHFRFIKRPIVLPACCENRIVVRLIALQDHLSRAF